MYVSGKWPFAANDNRIGGLSKGFGLGEFVVKDSFWAAAL